MSSAEQPIKLAIAAMGGQGGGVFSAWLVALAEGNQYHAQYTSVPGVAQRTGSTIYYLEFFPESLSTEAGKDPVMALMPGEGDVDIVVAGELVEAGRAITRGIVTPDKTTLIVSSHRLYSQAEKENLGDGRADSSVLIEAAQRHSLNFIGFDMNQAAIDASCMISAILFGSLAGSGQLPFTRNQFEAVIHQGGKAVRSNLAGFNIGFERAQSLLSPPNVEEQILKPYQFPESKNLQLQQLIRTIKNTIPEPAQEFASEGLKRLVDYQDISYVEQYLKIVVEFSDLDKSLRGEAYNFELSREVARYLALWMSYEDTIRVADLKIRQQRFTRYRDHVKAKSDDVAHVVEFMHPRIEEVADTMPPWLGTMILNVTPIRKFVGLFCKQRKINTSKLSGFLLLYVIAKFGKIRRSTLRYKREHKRINEWLELVKSTAKVDYQSAVGIAQCQRLIKGYGDTNERGWKSYSQIIKNLPNILDANNSNQILEKLRDAALADDTGSELSSALTSFSLEA